MPSTTHEALVLLFRNRPELAPELLRDALNVKVPAYTEARVESSDLTELQPTEYRADLVVLLVDGEPVLGIIVEVQLQKDERKRFTWPVYATNLRARLECPTCVLVVTPSEVVADWARVPIETGPGGRFEPLVVGPNAVPIIRDVETAKRDPELAVLSAMAHAGDAPELAAAIATAAVVAARSLDVERALLYSDLVRFSLAGAAQRAFEELMATGNYEYQSEFHRKADAHGKASAVVAFLDARGIPLTDEEKKRILGCTDLAVVDRWVRKAATVTSADELFAA